MPIVKCSCGNEYLQRLSTQTKCPRCTYLKAVASKSKNSDKKTRPPWNRCGYSKEKPTVKKKKSEKEKAKTSAWNWFSRWIRLTKSKHGVCFCITCGSVHGIKDCDAGHYISRTHASTLYDVDNVFPQCIKCNRFHQGKSYEFRENLIEKIGEQRVLELEQRAKEFGDDSTEYHKQIAEKYKRLVKEIEKKAGFSYWDNKK